MEEITGLCDIKYMEWLARSYMWFAMYGRSHANRYLVSDEW